MKHHSLQMLVLLIQTIKERLPSCVHRNCNNRRELASLSWQKYSVPPYGDFLLERFLKAAKYGCTAQTLQRSPSPRSRWIVTEIYPHFACLAMHFVQAVTSQRGCPLKFHSRVPAIEPVPPGVGNLLSFVHTSAQPCGGSKASVGDCSQHVTLLLKN